MLAYAEISKEKQKTSGTANNENDDLECTSSHQFIEKLVKEHKTHRSAIDFDKKFCLKYLKIKSKKYQIRQRTSSSI